MDATCIPTSHRLRAEAITNINHVFMQAKVMLVCDRDIMQIDISDLTCSTCETLLVTALVSDWNTRAWTFFEAFRARRTIHLLCKNNAVVSLKQVFQTVCSDGPLDIAILTLAMGHAVPPFDDSSFAMPFAPGDKNRFETGYLTAERSGRSLINRPASRPGDDIVIWSLLMNENTVFQDAEAFWRNLQAAHHTGQSYYEAAQVETGYLVSSIPRLNVQGLSWAPVSPTSSFSTQGITTDFENFEGRASVMGFIRPEGLVADWWVWRFSNVDSSLFSDSPYLRNLNTIRKQFQQGYRWGAVLFPIEATLLGEFHGSHRLFWQQGGRSSPIMVVVCATNEANGTVAGKYQLQKTGTGVEELLENKNAVSWEWTGVHLWDNAEPQPPWQLVKAFCIS